MKSPVMKDAYTRIFYWYSANGEFDINQENVTEKDIKSKCKEKFNYYENEINNISLFYIDDENDKNLLTNKLYRQAKYPILGKHWYLLPICLLKHWWFLLTHKLGGFFKLVFKKNDRKELFDKLGI